MAETAKKRSLGILKGKATCLIKDDFEMTDEELIFPFEPEKICDLPTPYNTFGAAETLMNALTQSDTDKSQ